MISFQVFQIQWNSLQLPDEFPFDTSVVSQQCEEIFKRSFETNEKCKAATKPAG